MPTISNHKVRTLERAIAEQLNVASMLIELDQVRPETKTDARALGFQLIRVLTYNVRNLSKPNDVAQQIHSELWAYLLGGGEDIDAATVRSVVEKVLSETAEHRATLG